MGWKRILIIVLVTLDVVAVNAGVGYLFYKTQNSNNNSQTENTTPLPPPSLGGGIEESGIALTGLETRLKALEDKLKITPVPTKAVVPVKTAVRQKTRAVQYVTIPGSGTTMSNDWVNLAGTEFYFNPADYPGLVEIYFEANIRLFNGNGTVYIQLFNATNGVGVQGSDVQTNLQADTVVTSGKVTFWAGRNLIRVQAKSLTPDTAIYSSGRLRIVTEN